MTQMSPLRRRMIEDMTSAIFRRRRNDPTLPLPPKCPDLNSTENIWQFMRDNWLSNRVFTSYENLLDHCCEAWKQAHRPTMAHHVHRNARLGMSSDQGVLVLDVQPLSLAMRKHQ